MMSLCGLLQSEKVTDGHNWNCFCGLHGETLMLFSVTNSRGFEIQEETDCKTKT